MYYQRTISRLFARAMRSFPAVLVTGPRQSGKTTFVRHELGEGAAYVSFDDPLERELATTDPQGFLQRFAAERPVIFDEIQYVPGLLSYLKLRIDQDRARNGKWVLTGSQQFNMMQAVSESLAGRIAVLSLLPFHYREGGFQERGTCADRIWDGGYPAPKVHQVDRQLWLSSYIQTYLERDVRQLHNIKDINVFQTFLELCAAHHAQELNYAELSRACGVSQPTIKQWISTLQASFIIYLLRPFHANLGKRLIKSPKLYFLDSALAAYLTSQPTPEALWAGHMGGAFFEGYIVTETHKILNARDGVSELYFWRSQDRLEIDLLLVRAGRVHPVEIKQTGTPTLRHAQPLTRLAAILGRNRIGSPMVVCNSTARRPLGGDIEAVPWDDYLASLIPQ